MRYSGAVPAHVSPTLRRSGEAVGSRRRPPTHIYQTYIYSVNNSPWTVAALIYYLLTSGAHVVRGRCRVPPPPGTILHSGGECRSNNHSQSITEETQQSHQFSLLRKYNEKIYWVIQVLAKTRSCTWDKYAFYNNWYKPKETLSTVKKPT